MFGIQDPVVALAYVLSIASTLRREVGCRGRQDRRGIVRVQHP